MRIMNKNLVTIITHFENESTKKVPITPQSDEVIDSKTPNSGDGGFTQAVE